MYIDRWSRSSDNFRGQGCYSWMASQLSRYSPKFIFDVGCGDGTGLLALKSECKTASRIISCDDNLYCLETAFGQLVRCGITVTLIKRLIQSAAGEGFHKMEAELGKLILPDNSEITLVQGDVIWDLELIEFLQTLPKFDAVTVWLIGTYDMKPQCGNMKEKYTPINYRLKVQNTVYELADCILQVGGVLQIVDRGEVLKEDSFRQDHLNSHQEQAQGTSLEVLDVQSKEYQEAALGGITMEASPGKSGRIPVSFGLAMNSTISVKR
jgi:hypothetical protein